MSMIHLCLVCLVSCTVTLVAADPGDRFVDLLEAWGDSQRSERQSAAAAVQRAEPEEPPRAVWRAIGEVVKDRQRELGRLVDGRAIGAIAQVLAPQMAEARSEIIRQAQKPKGYDKNAKGIVQQHVTALRRIWEDPLGAAGPAAAPLREQQAALGRIYADLQELQGYLALWPTVDNDLVFVDPGSAETWIEDIAKSGLRPEGSDAIMAYNQTRSWLADEEKRLLWLMNDHRAMVGLPAMEVDARLCRAAQAHCRDMAQHSFFNHKSPVLGKEQPVDRTRLAGYNDRSIGENIAKDQSSATGAFNAWCDSPGHHSNMLRPFTQIGVGHYTSYWTQVFGMGRSVVLGKGRRDKVCEVVESILALGDRLSPDQRRQVAGIAAQNRLIGIALEHLEALVRADPSDAQSRAALQQMKEAMEKFAR